MNTSAAAANSDFQFPPSPSHHHLFASAPTHQNHRKKRSKLIRISNTPSTSTGAISKPKYGKKPDPGAPKITRPCSECGKKFWSWKALFGHMRCHPERQWRGINPPPNFRQTGSPAKSLVRGFKEAMSVEDHEVAASLLMLANGPSAMEVSCGVSYPNVQECYEPFVLDNAGTSLNCRFECSSCKKVFGSHQALGGHRASHKNVKGCFAITRSDSEVEDHNERDCEEFVAKESSGEEKMAMVLGGNGQGYGHGHEHKCSICWRVFSSGQALGGHKRCHWEKGEEPLVTRDQGCRLDLNLPAPAEDDLSSTTSYSSGLTLDLRLGL